MYEKIEPQSYREYLLNDCVLEAQYLYFKGLTAKQAIKVVRKRFLEEMNQ